MAMYNILNLNVPLTMFNTSNVSQHIIRIIFYITMYIFARFKQS